ncbi:MAG TPA: HNH endonuclease signature motif containing protein [Longimicrobium sp.]|jgi:hypothetical protein
MQTALVHEHHNHKPYEVDHILSLKHGGRSDLRNFAFACFDCNRFKGTDVGSIVPGSAAFTRLYNPRMDVWPEHFRLDLGVFIIGITGIGAATARVLDLNARGRILGTAESEYARVVPRTRGVETDGLGRVADSDLPIPRAPRRL